MSTLKVANIESQSGGGVSAKISDVGGGQLSNRNLIINGAMQVAQRGTSSTSTGYYSIDRWKTEGSGGTITQSQHTLSSTDDPYSKGFRSSFHLNVDSAGSDTAADFLYLAQYIEAQYIAQSGWNYTSSSSYITLSFNVKSSLAGTYYVYLRALDATNRAYVKAFTLTADTWSEVTCTVPGDSTLVFNDDNGAGLELSIRPYVGTNYSDSGVSTGVWFTRSATSQTPDYGQNFVGTVSATFEITGVQLEVGDFATTFEHRNYGDEFARCQRYFQAFSTQGLHGRGSSSSSTVYDVPIVCEMRELPSVESLSIGAQRRYDNTAASGAGSGSVGTMKGGTASMDITGLSSVTDNYSIWLAGSWNFDAEL